MTESRIVVPSDWGEGEMKLLFNGYRVCLGMMKKFWRWVAVKLHNIMDVLNAVELYTENG